MVLVGGGVIGLEMGSVYSRLGKKDDFLVGLILFVVQARMSLASNFLTAFALRCVFVLCPICIDIFVI